MKFLQILSLNDVSLAYQKCYLKCLFDRLVIFNMLCSSVLLFSTVIMNGIIGCPN